MNNTFAIAAVAALVASLSAVAQGGPTDIRVTEAFVGLSGEDGTRDWFEITNLGNTAIDTGTLIYDDDSADIALGGLLDSFTLGAGESMIFLISADNSAADDVTFATAIAEFQSIWNYSGLIGITNGGGALGQSGDAVNLFLASDSSLATMATIPGSLSGGLASIDLVNDPMLSMLGVNGAYESNAFFNDNLGLPNNMATLIASPGSIPTPSAVMLLAAGGLVGSRRRR